MWQGKAHCFPCIKDLGKGLSPIVDWEEYEFSWDIHDAIFSQNKRIFEKKLIQVEKKKKLMKKKEYLKNKR